MVVGRILARMSENLGRRQARPKAKLRAGITGYWRGAISPFPAS